MVLYRRRSQMVVYKLQMIMVNHRLAELYEAGTASMQCGVYWS